MVDRRNFWPYERNQKHTTSYEAAGEAFVVSKNDLKRKSWRNFCEGCSDTSNLGSFSLKQKLLREVKNAISLDEIVNFLALDGQSNIDNQ